MITTWLNRLGIKASHQAWFFHTFYTLIEHGAVRVLDALVTLCLIRALTTTSFGLFSVYQSWVGMALLLLPSLELALYRDYARLKSQGTLSQELSVYRTFNVLKIVFASFLILSLSFIQQNSVWSVRFFLLCLAFALPLSQALYGFLREPLRFEMRQKTVAFLSALQRIVLLAALYWGGKASEGNPLIISSVALVIYALFGWIWFRASKDLFGNFQVKLGLMPTLMKATTIFTSTVLWIHINGVITQFIQTLDTFCLNLFHADLTKIAVYSIALKAANFFQILPVALISPFGVFLGRRFPNTDNDKKEVSYVLIFTAVYVVLCSSLYGIGMSFKIPILEFVGRSKIDSTTLPEATAYFQWHLAGVLLLCSTFPLSTYLGARASLLHLFKFIFLPWAILSAALYLFAASRGFVETAMANVFIYGILFTLLVLFLVCMKSGRFK